MRSARLAYLIAGLVFAQSSSASELPMLEPYQVMRSLGVLQDRIAGGEQSALPMQGKLLTMADKVFNESPREILQSPKNIKALVIYGLTGGNPRTVLSLLPAIPNEDPNNQLAEGIAHYVRGERANARKAFGKIDPVKLDGDIGAPVALAIGSANAKDDPDTAIAMLKFAVLQAPGTLVEEAALRRLIAMYLHIKDTDKFIKTSERYARRFYGSPYAGQFADMFVSGAVNLQDLPDPDQIRVVADNLPPSHRNAIYLRVARSAAVKGLNDLSAHLSALVEPIAGQVKTEPSPDAESPANAADSKVAELRSKLYAGISTLRKTGETEQLTALQNAASDELPAEDRKLLAAALAVAKAISEPIAMTASNSEAGGAYNGEKRTTEQTIGSETAKPGLEVLDSAETLISSMRQKLQTIDQRIEKESK